MCPVSRLFWLIGRVGVAVLLVVLAGFTAGLFGWIGAASQHVGVLLATLLQAGLNDTVPAVLVLEPAHLSLACDPSSRARLATQSSHSRRSWIYWPR